MNLIKKKQKYRLKFHLMPPKGWMNDPNGLCFYKGLYHVFFQYALSGPCAYERYWGHYTSSDMLNWKYEGIAVKSDCPWDENGAFSGCGFTEDGVMELFYTGNVEEEGEYDYIHAGRGANVIYLQSEDGFCFGDKKLLLTNKDYPSDYTCHVRDPKVWKEGDFYHMVLGGRKNSDRGAILHYLSRNKIEWMLKEEISSKDDFGFMWECPDVFELDGETVLMCCPQGVKRGKYRFQNPHQAGYWILPKDEALVRDLTQDKIREINLEAASFVELDKGFDFYAPQTFMAPDGRRILYGWGGVSEMDREYNNAPIIEEGWQHSLTVPRELHIEKGLLKQWPVKELEALRYDEQALGKGAVELSTDAFDLEASVTGEAVSIQLGEDVFLDWKDGIFALRFLNESGCGRKIRRAEIEKLHHLRVLKDVSMLEIYINGGEYVFTTRYFPEDTAYTRLTLQGCGKTTLWKMKAMEVDLSNGE
ncbi:MAG: glycoside hydrolase family 32 protein [Lachnospiraceae bacterium]|nr:glycoside hydrolase family 32 protein [Lachnospiraceae bacterium]